ncbi:MAG TPA: hypothetical protein VMK65_11890 [Longimicrobiales bacterium]|nr:hypothetical protein [Longimicrobiales bacterium]
MAATPVFPATVRDPLRRALESLGDVEGVVLDDQGGGIWLLCNPTMDRTRAEARVRELIQQHGLDDGRLGLEFLVRLSRVPQQRVRLLTVDRAVQSDGRVAIHVELEWLGEHFEGRAEGAGGETIELRTASNAALAALRAAARAPLDVRIVGVKAVRAFDADLVVVSVVQESSPARSLVGTASGGGQPTRAAAMAVLQALNRVMGNSLEVGDR